MKKRFMVILLAGGLTLGLCGCGGGGSASAMPEELGSAIEDAPTEGMSEEPEIVAREETQEQEVGETGELSTENTEDTTGITMDEPGAANEVKAPIAPNGIDLSEIMTNHVVEYEDLDGYQIQETIRFSPIFCESDMDILLETWKALGGNAEEIPVGDKCYSWDSSAISTQKALGFTGGQYIVGDRTITNQTDGFPITSANAKNYALMIRMDTNDLSADAYLAAEDSTMAFTFFGGRSEQYRSRVGSFLVGTALMEEDQWGPMRFIIVLPNKVTPNEPNGLDYSKIKYSAVVSGALKEKTEWSVQYY